MQHGCACVRSAEESLESVSFCARRQETHRKVGLIRGLAWTVGQGGDVIVNTQGGGSHFFSPGQEGSASVSVTLALFDLRWTWSNGWCVSGQPIKREERGHAPKTKPRPPSEVDGRVEGKQGRGGRVMTAGPRRKSMEIRLHCFDITINIHVHICVFT